MSDKKYSKKIGKRHRKKNPAGLWIAIILTFCALVGAIYLSVNLDEEVSKAPPEPETVSTVPETMIPTEKETTSPTVPVENKPVQKITQGTVTSSSGYSQNTPPQQAVPNPTVPQAAPTIPEPNIPQATAVPQPVPVITQPAAEPWSPAPSETCAHTTLIGAGQECFEHFAKCTTPGNGVYVCAACHEVIERPEPDRYPAKGHDIITEQDGSTWCYRCGVVLSAPTPTEPPQTEPITAVPIIPDPSEMVPGNPVNEELPSETPPVMDAPAET